MDISWKKFKDIASEQIEKEGCFIYRGQRDSKWSLVSSLMRTDLVWSQNDFQSYFNSVLPQIMEKVESWDGRTWDLSSQLGLAEFVAYLQHNGFPTPLLDWSYSPYVAAYFAFESIDHFAPQNEKVSIYCFNHKAWGEKYKQEYDITHDTAHVSILRPRTVGNHKLALQQGCFTFSNAKDIKSHIQAHENESTKYLTEYTLDVAERPKVISELTLMGISAVQLMPSIESVCKKALNDLIGLRPIGRGA